MKQHLSPASGSALVEALLVISLLVFCAGALLQLSLYTLDATRVEAAAREGARMVHLTSGRVPVGDYLRAQARAGNLGLYESGLQIESLRGVPDFGIQQSGKGLGAKLISQGLAQLGAISVRVTYIRPNTGLYQVITTKELSAQATVIVGTWKLGI